MSLSGINNTNLPIKPAASNRPEVGHSSVQNQAAATNHTDARLQLQQSAQLRPQAPIAGAAAATQSSVPVEAPPGTDPELWSVLTTEERNFFAKTAALGPLTYSRIKAASQPAAPSARGVRLDVRA